MPTPIVISMSAFQAFKRCRKSFYLGNVLDLEPNKTNEAVEKGASFHKWIERETRRQVYQESIVGVQQDEMYPIADAYMLEYPLPDPNDIYYVEEPIYTKILEPTLIQPAVYIRTTFDLVYRDKDWVVGRDYKTFERLSTHDLELDFQSRIYLAILRFTYGRNVKFEFEYVRRALPKKYDPKSKWTTADCYHRETILCSDREIDALWRETQQVARDILAARENGYDSYYRTDLRGTTPFTCHTCFYKQLCKADLAGALDDQTVALLAKPKEKISIRLDGHAIEVDKPRGEAA